MATTEGDPLGLTAGVPGREIMDHYFLLSSFLTLPNFVISMYHFYN